MAEKFTPALINGDGNCLFRAVSLALYHTESHHVFLRLQTALEMILNRAFYDIRTTSLPINYSDGILTSSYKKLVSDVLTDGRDMELVHVYGLSAAVGAAIRSYCPPGMSFIQGNHPFTRLISGRGVAQMQELVCID